jgi:hypothetical protein
MSATTLSEEIALAACAFRFAVRGQAHHPERVQERVPAVPAEGALVARVTEIDRVFMDAFPSEYDLRGSY